MPPSGQVNWDSRGAGSKEFVVEVETSKNIAKQFRFRSAFGKLSRPMKSVTIGQGQEENIMDIGASACIWSKEITTGDEVRFTLEQNIGGSPTFGDAEVQIGDYLAYLHQNIILNKLDTPAIPVQGEMSRQRVRAVIGDPNARIRSEITLYLAEQYVYDVLDGHFKGASMNLSSSRTLGGRALDLGLGAGVQISPENFLVKGDGFVSGVSGTTGYETAVETALGTLAAGDEIDRDYVHQLRVALTDAKIAPTNLAGSMDPKWYAPTDPDLMSRMTQPGGALAALWLDARERARTNPVFGHGAIELDDIVFFPEQRLKQYRPKLLGPGIVWGTNSQDRREYTPDPTDNIALMVIMGDGAMLEGHNGSVDITFEGGFHGKGQSIAGHIKQSFMRARWRPQDGRTDIVLNQSSMTIGFFETGPSF